MDDVFRALADASRRRLLDSLAERDGQTLTELEMVLPALTRFGVMNHLRVLDEVNLITTHKVGRFKYHYLNPVPIQLLADRWISRYAAPWARALGDVKRSVEEAAMAAQEPPTHVYTVLIRATPEQVWQGLTDPAFTRQYYFGTSVRSDWQVGAPFTYTQDDGTVVIEGTILEIDPPWRLVTTFSAKWDEATAEDPPSRVTYLLEAMGQVTKLTITHDGFGAATTTFQQVGGGVPLIASSLKTLLETGRPLPVG